MGIIDHLWDETLAGPRPDSFPSSAVAGATAVPKPLPVTRSITIVRAGHRFHSPDSTPSSPVSAPESPLTPGTPRSDWRRSLRKPPATSAAAAAEPRTPTVYDWVVISSLDK
ncbi:hypothetical protein IHE45_18G004600 [Dioscorea alata]|uniref:Uncharacterized protein n=2 Tax=Dioscorea alata TaxID=55571 RepID=A0ACB7U513_DIOAL|nr:hypothetical protein IHE45_18G004600 [Dioscorea alata]KAH7655351.1 hypothetical protein IHE45_18G004600 [Dioscorea alata]